MNTKLERNEFIKRIDCGDVTRFAVGDVNFSPMLKTKQMMICDILKEALDEAHFLVSETDQLAKENTFLKSQVDELQNMYVEIIEQRSHLESLVVELQDQLSSRFSWSKFFKRIKIGSA